MAEQEKMCGKAHKQLKDIFGSKRTVPLLLNCPCASLRILHVVGILNRGGIETLLMNLYRNMDRNIVQFDFLCHKKNGAYEDEIKSLGGRIYHIEDVPEVGHFKYIKGLGDFFKKHREYAIVHSHIDSRTGLILREAKKAGIAKRIAHSHNCGYEGSFLKKIYLRYSGLYVVKNATHFFACSEVAAKWLFKDRLYNSGNVTLLKNSIETKLFNYNPEIRDKVRKQNGLQDKFVIGHVGSFIDRKNQAFLVDILNKIINMKDNALLLLIGDGPLHLCLQEKVKQMGLSDYVRFPGSCDDIYELMQAMDLFVFPSKFEGLGIVLVEAQAAGLRCITSDTVPEEVNITGRVEFVSLKQSAEYWAERILNVECDRVNTLDTVCESGYDIENTARKLQEFYMSQLQDAWASNEAKRNDQPGES